MGLGIGSFLKKQLKSLEKEAKRGVDKVESETFRRVSDFTQFATLGLVNPNQIKRGKEQQKKLEKEAKKAQLKQKRASLVDQAKLEDEIASRGATRARGGRLSLLRSGETGSLLA